jgi:hypothetical protein
MNKKQIRKTYCLMIENYKRAFVLLSNLRNLREEINKFRAQ